MLIRRRGVRLSVSPGFLFLVALMLYLDDGSGIFLWTITAAIIHELGHVFAAAAFHGRVSKIVLGATGAELSFEYPLCLSYAKENLVAFMGPLLNLLAAVPALCLEAYLPALISLGLGLFNLLPIFPMDGGRIFNNIFSDWFGPDVGGRVSIGIAAVVLGGLVLMGLISAVRFANGLVLIVSLWLLLGTVGKQRKFFKKM